MQDKITFGKFIKSKRNEAGISQKALAEKLYVTESAVSKWERGLSYPDITMISPICTALNITEHELCTASVDENQRKIEKLAEKYKKFIAVYNIIIALGYLSAIIPCFIIFVIKQHNVSQFFILLTSLMMSASLLNVPTLIEKNKGLITLGSFYISLNLLLLSGSIYSHGDWFLMAFLSVTLGFCVVFLPFVVRCDFISRYVGKNKALVCMSADSLMILAVVACGTLTYGTTESLITGITACACVFVLAWGIFAVTRYAKINIFFKSSAVLAMISVWMFSAEKIALFFLPSNIDFSITISNDISTAEFCAIVAGISVILASAGFVFRHLRR